MGTSIYNIGIHSISKNILQNSHAQESSRQQFNQFGNFKKRHKKEDEK
jgi:hypothetical protein